MTLTHKTIEPAILYLGTPVILNSTLNPDGSYNLAPISSVRANSVMADEYDYWQHERSEECTLEGITCLEVRVQRVHVAPSLLMPHDQNRIDFDL